MTQAVSLQIPYAFKQLDEPYKIKVYYGGRGSAKTWSFAIGLILISLQKRVRIVCCREIQESIALSVYTTIVDILRQTGLDVYYTITKNEIICNKTKSTFYFRGLYRNVSALKGLKSVDVCFVDEAEKVSQESWDFLLPTVLREDGSELWIAFNPDTLDDPVYTMFVKNQRPNSYVRKINWNENPFISKSLLEEKDWMQKTDPDKYQWIWEGNCRTVSDALIFKGKFEVQLFETKKDASFYCGADFGFNDPSTLIRCYVHDNILYIDYEAYARNVDTSDLPKLYDTIPMIKKLRIIADSSRPDTIRELQKQGFNIVGADKGKGSVEDGIAFLRAFEKIVIHPRCKHAIEEFKSYCWEIDKRTGGIKFPQKPEDNNNHLIDSCRYAIEPIMKSRSIGRVYITGI